MNILFRVDASSKVGLGHLRRTLALAMELKRLGYGPVFLIDERGEKLPIRMPLSRIRGMGGRRWDLAVVDSYTILPKGYQKIRSATHRVAVVADGRDPGFDCDFLIDHNLYASQKMYPAQQGRETKLLVGPQYAMMSEEIVRARVEGFTVRDRIQKILLTLGGSTHPVETIRLLRMIAHIAQEVEMLIITPAQDFKSLLPSLLPHGNRYRVIPNPYEMGKVMRQADIAVTAAGVTSLELACIGVPTICVVLSDNQRKGAQEADRQGIGLNLGKPPDWKQSKFDLLYRALVKADLRKSMSRKARSLVDGRGVKRVALELVR